MAGKLVRLAHVLAAGPFLIYLGATAARKPPWAYRVALVLGALLAAVMAWMLVLLAARRRASNLWLLVHLLVVSPLLLWLGASGDAAPRAVTSLVLALGCAATGYHLLSLAGARAGRERPGPARS